MLPEPHGVQYSCQRFARTLMKVLEYQNNTKTNVHDCKKFEPKIQESMKPKTTIDKIRRVTYQRSDSKQSRKSSNNSQQETTRIKN